MPFEGCRLSCFVKKFLYYLVLKKFKYLHVESPVEFIASLFSIVAFIGFAVYMFFSVKQNEPSIQTIQYNARFNDIDGISVGSGIKLAGYKVGTVRKITILPETYDVRVDFEVTDNIKIPLDTTIAVKTSGFFGGKFLAILPGAEEDYLVNGDEVIYTQSAINLENLIGKFVNT